MNTEFSDSVWQQISGAGSVFLWLDFDGTLAPIVNHPGEAKMTRKTDSVLRKLVCRDDTIVTVLSGRTLGDIRERVGILGVNFVGGHGWSWQVGEKTGTHPLPEHARRTLGQLSYILENLATEIPGTICETKHASVAFHYRNLRGMDEETCHQQVTKSVAPFIASGSAFELEGKKVWEYIVAPVYGKGLAADTVYRMIRKRYPQFPHVHVAFGDDRTDEDLFVSHPDWLTFRVGDCSYTAAKFRIPDTGTVQRILEGIALIREERSNS